MAQETAVERGTGQIGDGCLQGVKAVIEWQQGVFAEGHDDGLLLGGKDRGRRRRPHGGILHRRSLAPLRDGLGIDVIACGERSQALLTMLDRATHRRRRCGAAVKYLSHNSLEVGIFTFRAPPLLGTEHLACALSRYEFKEAERLWAFVALVVVMSILVHGVMATPITRRLDRRRFEVRESA